MMTMMGIKLLSFAACLLAALTDGRSIRKKSVPLMVPPVAIMGSIPGVPGTDYPVLERVPRTSFQCDDRLAGYYADVEASCQVFHICQDDGRHDRFLCPNGTLFNQNFFICDWWYNVQCTASPDLYFLNKLFRPQLRGLIQNEPTQESSISATADRATIPRTEVPASASAAGPELVPTEANRGQDQAAASQPASDQANSEDSDFDSGRAVEAEEQKVTDAAAGENNEPASGQVDPADGSRDATAVPGVADQGVAAFASASSSSSSSTPSLAFASAAVSLPSLFTVSSTPVAPKINVVVPDIKATGAADKRQSYGIKVAPPSKEWRLKSVNGVEYDSQLPIISTSVRISNSETPLVNSQSAVNAALLAADSNGLPAPTGADGSSAAAHQTADQVAAQLDIGNDDQLADNLEAAVALEPVDVRDDQPDAQAEQATEQATGSTTAMDVMDATSLGTSGQQNAADSSSWSQASQEADNRLTQLTSSGAIDGSAADDGRQAATESISGQTATFSLMDAHLHDDGKEMMTEEVALLPAESTTFIPEGTEATEATEAPAAEQTDADIEPIVAVFFQIGEPQTTTEYSTTETSVSQLDDVVN